MLSGVVISSTVISSDVILTSVVILSGAKRFARETFGEVEGSQSARHTG
jgi:hypothetical protein